MRQKLTPSFPALRVALALAVAGAATARAEAPLDPAIAAQLAKEGFDDRHVDDNAVRYYAASGQKQRAEAELQRLRRLYPNWTPPDEIMTGAAAPSSDEEDLWDLFAADKLDELAKAIAQRTAAEPGWRPSADLSAKFKAKLLRAKITGFAKDQHYGEIIRWLKSSGATLDGADIDVLWTVAEAYQKSGQSAPAFAIYQSILTNNNDPSQRLATIQKSFAGLRIDEIEQLLAMAHKDASGRGEFASLAPDIARVRIAAFLHDELRREVGGDDIKIFGDFAKSAGDPNQAGMLAWYYYKLKDYPRALDWFKFALSRGGDAMVAHGLAHTLRLLGLKRDAEEVAFAWRKPLANNSILFIDLLETDLTRPIPPYVEPERLARYGEVTMETASGEGAQALAWYAYNSCQFDVARQWFARAVAWRPKAATVYGYALALRRLKERRGEIELVNRYDGLFPNVVELLFPDDRPRPPTPCEQRARGFGYTSAYLRAADGQNPYAFAREPAPLYAQAAPSGAAPWRWGQVTAPGGAVRAAAMRRVNRAEFPIRVDPQNPLRFEPTGQPPIVNVAVGDAAPAAPGGFIREPAAGAFPLVARRVPGVGAMPYERYGFALLPGYNGITTPTSPTAAEQIAPAGTLWSLERQQPGQQEIDRNSLESAADPNAARAQWRPAAPPAPHAGAEPGRNG
ncbi:MAG TPA: hypothetical protein VMU18_01435 [Rhodoblastus sp.]|nr:hypothetical protein [Rhodoblastus sp.]